MPDDSSPSDKELTLKDVINHINSQTQRLEGKIEKLGTDLRGEMSQMKKELRGEMSKMKDELIQEMNRLHDESYSDIGANMENVAAIDKRVTIIEKERIPKIERELGLIAA